MSSTDRLNKLLLAEDWRKVYQSFRNADFTSYDFDNLRRSMIGYLRQNYPEDFNDYLESSEYLALIEARIEAFPDPEATPKNDRQTTEQAPNESASVPTGKKTVAIDGSRVQELMDSGLSKKDAVQQAIEEANPVGAKKNEQSATDKLAGAMAEPAAESPAPAAENTTQTTNEDGIETEEKDGQGQERNEQLPQLTPAPAAGGQSPVAEPSVAATKERKAKAMNKPPRKKKPKTIRRKTYLKRIK